jgi:hypothetical protein
LGLIDLRECEVDLMNPNDTTSEGKKKDKAFLIIELYSATRKPIFLNRTDDGTPIRLSKVF